MDQIKECMYTIVTNGFDTWMLFLALEMLMNTEAIGHSNLYIILLCIWQLIH